MEIKPFPQLPESERHALGKRRQGGRIDRQDILILILSGLVFLIATLLGIKTIMADPVRGTNNDSAATRLGPEHGMAWLREELKLTDGQRAKIRPLLKDEHIQFLGFRQDSSLSPHEERAELRDVRAKTVDQVGPLPTGNQQSTLRWMQAKMKGRIGERRHRDER